MMSVTVHGCSASAPTPERGMPAISVQIGGDVLLLDCGEGTQRQMMRHGVSYAKVYAILISHLHLDHFLGVFGLAETLRLSGRDEPLNVFGPRGSKGTFGISKILTVREFEAEKDSPTIPLFDLPSHTHSVSAFPVSHGQRVGAFGYIIRQKPYLRFHEEKAKKAGLKGAMFTEIQEKGELKIGKKTLKLSDLTYEQPGKKIVYTGDTVFCKSVIEAAHGADLLIHDCTFAHDLSEEAKEKFHSTAKEAGIAAHKAKAKRLLLTHISSRYADPSALVEEAKKEFSGEVIAAKDGLKIEI